MMMIDRYREILTCSDPIWGKAWPGGLMLTTSQRWLILKGIKNPHISKKEKKSLINFLIFFDVYERINGKFEGLFFPLS